MHSAPLALPPAACDPRSEVGTARDEETVSAIFDRMRALTSVARAVRCCGSCAMNMCGVAMGRLDVFYEIGERRQCSSRISIDGPRPHSSFTRY